MLTILKYKEKTTNKKWNAYEYHNSTIYMMSTHCKYISSFFHCCWTFGMEHVTRQHQSCFIRGVF